jgi:hypothetical protein
MKREHFNFNTALLGICLGLIGFFGRSLVVKVDTLGNDFTDMRIEQRLSAERLKAAEAAISNQSRQLNTINSAVIDHFKSKQP